MAFIGAKPTNVPLTSADLEDSIITSAKIVDGTIATADISDGAVTSVKTTGVGVTNTPSFFAVRGSSQSMASGTDVKIQLDNEQIDTASAYDNSSNYRFTVPSGQGGKYYVTFQIRRSGWGSNILRSQLRINGGSSNQVTAEDECSGINDYASAGGSAILSLNAGDYIELYGYQNTGSSQNVYGSTTDRATYMGAFKLAE
nr:hypothetical protein [uncultured Mediterranean phage uvMED]